MAEKMFDMDHKDTKIQTREIDGELWFRADQTFAAFGRKFNANNLRVFPGDQKQKLKISLLQSTKFVEVPKQNEVWFISEPAVYTLAFRSDTEEAIAFTRSVAEFRKKVRKGEVTAEDLAQAQKETQLFLFQLTAPELQRPVNHSWNYKSGKNKPAYNSEVWAERYKDYYGLEFHEIKQILLDRGCPEWVLNRSVQDGLRWFEDTYEGAIAMSDISQLADKRNLSESQAREIVKAAKKSYMLLGEVYGKVHALERKHRKREKLFVDDEGHQVRLFKLE